MYIKNIQIIFYLDIYIREIIIISYVENRMGGLVLDIVNVKGYSGKSFKQLTIPP